MDRTDKSLIDAHCQGDQTAFAELVRRYGGSVLGYLKQICRNQELAEDFFQETFKKVHEKARTFRGTQLKPWLFTIATNVALNGLHKNNRIRAISIDPKMDCTGEDCKDSMAINISDNSNTPLEDAVLAEQKQKVRQAVDFLPPKQRATLVLAYYQQRSYNEVAQIMDCSVGTVKTQMFRALRSLAQKLPEIGGEVK